MKPAPIYPVIGLHVADQRLDRLAPLEQPLLVVSQRFVLAAVNDLHARVVRVHTLLMHVHDRQLFGLHGWMKEAMR
jgi:hypothetical protein